MPMRTFLKKAAIAARLKTAAVAAGLFCLAPSAAWAQFAGDVFFETPSVAIPAGETGQLDLVIFTGGEAFGAASVRLDFDPDALEIVDVAADTDAVRLLDVHWSQTDGSLSIVTLNGAALDAPIGTVRIAGITVRPLAGAGSVIDVDATLDDALTADSDGFASRQAFDAEIVVTTPSAASAMLSAAPDNAGAPLAVRSGPLHDRARRLAPDGAVVALRAPDGSTVRVTTARPGARED